MATLKQRLHRKSVSGFYDVVHLESDATVIKINSDDTETKTVSDYLPKIQDTDDTPTGINPGQIVTGTSKVFICTGDGTIRTFKEVAGGSVPVKDKDFTYSGNCEVIDDTDEVSGVQWRIKFLTSGMLVVIEQWLADLFLVGGGGNGSQAGVAAGGGGGGGGYADTISNITIEPGTSYSIIIGGAGGASSAFGYNVNPGGNGKVASTSSQSGGDGSAKGGSGSTASDGKAGNAPTVFEFGLTGATAYAGGGGGGAGHRSNSSSRFAGGAGGGAGAGSGGTGGYTIDRNNHEEGYAGSSATANTGSGGGGGGSGSGLSTSGKPAGGSGGSGIIIIRKHKD